MYRRSAAQKSMRLIIPSTTYWLEIPSI